MEASTVDFRVVKIGGSLLDLPGLGERISAWLNRQAPAVNLLIVGGGRLVDQIRQLDRVHGIGEAAAHQLCLDALGVTARVLAASIPGARLVTSRQQWDATSDCGLPVVLDVAKVLEGMESSSDAAPLPHRWEVTSDSIAARIARWAEARLVLLKSTDSPSPVSIESAAAAGYVDGYFPDAVRGLAAVRLVNFRCPGYPEWTLTE